MLHLRGSVLSRAYRLGLGISSALSDRDIYGGRHRPAGTRGKHRNGATPKEISMSWLGHGIETLAFTLSQRSLGSRAYLWRRKVMRRFALDCPTVFRSVSLEACGRVIGPRFDSA